MTLPADSPPPGSPVQQALAAGLPAWHVAALEAERWHQQDDLDGGPPVGGRAFGAEAAGLYWQAVDDALRHPQAPAYDELWVRRMRRVRGLQ